MQQPLRILLTVVLVILALLAGNWVWNYYLYAPWTRDGKVRAEIITLSPDVSGWVRELHIRDDQTVQQGDPLFRIDDIRYRATLARAGLPRGWGRGPDPGPSSKLCRGAAGHAPSPTPICDAGFMLQNDNGIAKMIIDSLQNENETNPADWGPRIQITK